MKRIFRTIIAFASLFFSTRNVHAKNENLLVEKAHSIQQRIFQEYKSDHNQNNLITYINKHHNLEKIETEVSERLEIENWFNWYNWSTWDTWNNWSTWDTWNNWSTWDTWYNWSTWDNWRNWFNWTNY